MSTKLIFEQTIFAKGIIHFILPFDKLAKAPPNYLKSMRPTKCIVMALSGVDFRPLLCGVKAIILWNG